MYENIKELFNYFKIPFPREPSHLSSDLISLRINLMKEELAEVEEAMLGENLLHIAKELADLAYTVLGTAQAYGLPFEEIFDAVHKSNMSKSRAPAEATKRGHQFDLVKGLDYQDPYEDILEILNARR